MQIFRSKIDWWVLGFIISMSGLLLQLLFTMYAKGTMVEYPETYNRVYPHNSITLVANFTTRYSLNKDVLMVRSLFFKWHIPLASIQKISATDHLNVSPALSLQRLRIEYLKDGQKQVIFISPKRSMLFVRLYHLE